MIKFLICVVWFIHLMIGGLTAQENETQVGVQRCMWDGEPCQCSILKNGLVSFKCSSSRLNSPAEFPNDLDWFANTSSSYIVHICYKNYPSIERIVSENLILSVEQLDLSQNVIEVIKASIFDNLIGLQRVYLRNNNLKSLDFLVNKNIENVTSLDLRDNLLEVLEPSWFRYLRVIKYLKLDLNLITIISPRLFSNMQTLVLLSLLDNNIEEIKSGAFENLTNLIYLDLNVNLIVKIEEYSFKGCASLIGRTEDANFMILSNQNIKVIESFAFADLSNVSYFNLKKNDLMEIANFTFYSMTALNSLSFDDNFIKFIDIEAFDQSLASRLLFLNLSINHIDKINKTNFVQLKSLRFLYLDKNKIDEIEPYSFNGQSSSLVDLRLRFNKIGYIKTHHFNNLTALEKLYFSKNQISSIEDMSFATLNRLKELDLSHNCIFSLSPNVFYGLNNLEYLSLSYNLIYTIDHRVFANLTLLKNLDLSNNIIKELPDYLFVNLNSLGYLNLSNNWIFSIENSSSNVGMFAGLNKLVSLKLSNNFISVLTNNSFAGISPSIMKSLFLDNNLLQPTHSLSVFPFTSLAQLDLSYNPQFTNASMIAPAYGSNMEIVFKNMSNLFIKSWIDSLTMSIASKIRRIDLSFNDLSQLFDQIPFQAITFLYELNLRSTNLNSSTFIFRGVRDFLNLDLSDNPRIQYDDEFLSASSLSIKILKVANTSIKSLDILKLPRFTSISAIDVSRNKLEAILKTDFQSINRLISINASYNKIQYIENGSFVSNYDLDYIDFSFNNLKCIQHGVFSTKTFNAYRFTNLIMRGNRLIDFYFNASVIIGADLSENQLTAIPDSIKNRYDGEVDFEMTYLYIASNLLDRLAVDSFNRMKSLEELNLSNNRISILEDRMFADLGSLIVLDLSKNNLSRIGKDSFVGLMALSYLYLSNNKIDILLHDCFSGLSNLIVLDLNMNSIKYIMDNSFSSLKYAKRLELNHLSLVNMTNSTFTGLESLTSFEVNSDLLDSSNEINSLIVSLTRGPTKHQANLTAWYEVIMVNFDRERNLDRVRYCSMVIYFAKANILLNLPDDDGLNEFFKLCNHVQFKSLDFDQFN